MQVDWIWLGIGILFALFIIPLIQVFFSSRKSSGGGDTQL